MTEPIDPDLERTAGVVADQDRPDWETTAPRRPDLRRAVAGLRVMARLAAAHLEARRASGLGDDASSTRADGEAEPSLREPAFEWGFLRALDRIGAGSFGEVWRAWDPSLEREVALKLRRLAPPAEGGPPLARTSDPATRHWLDEARRLASVRHPNVLTVYGAAEHAGRAGLWTELVRGESVEDRLSREGPLALREVARIGRDLSRALSAVHEAGLVHGDVKASNVMLEPGPAGATNTRVVLMDFGAAHAAAGASRRGSGPIGSTGTPLVMAPEVLGSGPASASSDLYAVGVMMFRMATGRYPVEAETLDALRERHARGDRLELEKLRAGVPPGLARLIDRALSPRPEARPATATELARALEAFADRGRGRWIPLIASGAAVAIALVATFATIAFRRPSANRYVPPEHLPGPRVEAMRLAGTAEGASLGEQFGNSVLGVGDVNGDGFADFISAGAHYTGPLYLQGRVALYLGNREGRIGQPAWVAYGKAAGDYFGAYLGAAGDVNHDGYADVLVTDQTPRASDHEEVRSVFLYLGSPGGLRAEPANRIMGWQPHASFGLATGIGDVNGDGYGDIAIGASNYSHRFPYEGAVFVYYGGPNGVSARPDWVVYGGARDAWLGNLMTRTGDVNHDGYDDLLVGAPGWKGEHTANVGRALLFLGGPHGLASTPAWIAEGNQPGGVMGYEVGGADDVNHDGFADAVVFQSGWSGRATREGRALLYLGQRDGLSRRPVWSIHGFSAGSAISTGNASLGDVNGDGIPDILIGSGLYSASLDRRQLGMAGIYLSPADPRRPHPAWYVVGDDPGTPIGAWMATAGDFNGDGLADMVVGQSGWPRGEQRGRVMLYFGQRVTLPR